MTLYQAQLSRDAGALCEPNSLTLIPSWIAKIAEYSRENDIVSTVHPGQHVIIIGGMFRG